MPYLHDVDNEDRKLSAAKKDFYLPSWVYPLVVVGFVCGCLWLAIILLG